MKQQIQTTGMVLSRTDYQEADRILTILTPDHGKQRVIAKGVRRPRSKLAGGIELFSISEFSILPGRGEMGTLISSRLLTHYDNIVKDITRTMLGYELLKRINKVTEDDLEEDYFDIITGTFRALNNLELPASLTELWFIMHMLRINGVTPNLHTDTLGNKLLVETQYLFDFDAMTFQLQPEGPFTAAHIKLLRLAYSVEKPELLGNVTGTQDIAEPTLKLAKMIQQYED